MNIHEKALAVFGLQGRLEKLGTEATELADAINRYKEGKCSIDNIVHEVFDCLYVLESIAKSHEFQSIVSVYYHHTHEYGTETKKGAKQKLEEAITKKENEA